MPRVADVRPLPGGPLRAAALAAGLPIRAATTVTGTREGGAYQRSSGVATQVGWFLRRIRNDRMRSRADVRRHDAERAAVLAVAREAALGRHAARLCSGHIGRTGAIGRRVPGDFRSARGLSDGYAQGEAAALAAGCRKSAPRAFAVSAIESDARRHACSVAGCSPRKAAGLRRFPERRHRPRIWRSRCAKASARSSTSSATPRPAWRPIRARPRT